MSSQTVVSQEELEQLMDQRAAFYRFMGSALLHEFTVEQIEQLRTTKLAAFTEAAGSLSPEAKEVMQRAKRYLSHPGVDPRTDLAVDYARVFLSAGVYDGLTAEPYESIFTSEDGLLMQDARDNAVRIYRENGVGVDPQLHMPEDHLGLELEFMASMAEKTKTALEADDSAEIARCIEVQRTFIADHLLNWLPALTEKVDEFAQLPLYPAIMRVIEGFLKEDDLFLADLKEALQ